MTRYFDFQLRQPKGPVKPIGQICIRILITEDDGTLILIDDIRSEKEIDTNINILIQELETIRKQAKRQFKVNSEQIPANSGDSIPIPPKKKR